MTDRKKRVEYVDRIIEFMDKAGGRQGPPKKVFTLTRKKLRDSLLLAYKNGLTEMKLLIHSSIEHIK